MSLSWERARHCATLRISMYPYLSVLTVFKPAEIYRTCRMLSNHHGLVGSPLGRWLAVNQKIVCRFACLSWIVEYQITVLCREERNVIIPLMKVQIAAIGLKYKNKLLIIRLFPEKVAVIELRYDFCIDECKLYLSYLHSFIWIINIKYNY